MPANEGVVGVLLTWLLIGCASVPPPTLSPSLSPSAQPTATPHVVLTPSPAPATPKPSPEPTMPAEAPIDAGKWAALEWIEGALERPAGSRPISVRDVARWGNGSIAVGHTASTFDGEAGNGLIWLSTDGVDWRLVSDDSEAFAEAPLCCVTRAREAFIAWTRDSGVFLSSVDGQTWQRTEQLIDGYGLAVTETREGLFALSRAEFDGQALTTTDGVEWHAHQTTGLHLVTAGGFNRGGGQVLVTRQGYFASGWPSQGGVQGGRYEWGSWYSPDGRTWREFKLRDEGPYRGANVRAYEEGPRFTFASEDLNTGAYIPDRSPWHHNWRTDNGVDWLDGEPARFPEVGRYDGHFTLDIADLFDGGPTRLSADGIEVVELESRGDELRRVTADAYLHTAVGRSGIAVLADNGQGVWFGRAVVEPAAHKPAVFCGPFDIEMCLYLVGQVAGEETEEGTAFVLDHSCIGWFTCWSDDRTFAVVAVPPDWPASGELRRWDYTEGTLSPGSVTGLPGHIRARLPHDGPWTDALVGDRLWVHFNGLDRDGVRQVMVDHSISGADTVRYLGERSYWVAVGITDGLPAAAKLEFLRRDRRICAADFLRFDAVILKGGEATSPLEPPNVVGCATP